MGRSLKKDIFGTNVLGLPGSATVSDTNTGIAVSGYFGGALSTAYVLIKQRGANTYVVAKKETFTGTTSTGLFTLTSMSTQAEVSVGDELSGIGIPAGARVVSIDSGTQVTMDKAATASAAVTVTTIGTYQVGKLVNTTPDANGEILIQGYNSAGAGQGVQVTANLVPIRKLTKRLAYGFPTVPVLSGGIHRGEDDNTATNHDGVRYTWFLENDSSADYIVLTQVS
jgi:hypothetical protein